MKKIFMLLLACMHLPIMAQTLYFPPLSGDEWEQVEPESLGWCTAHIPALYDYLEDQHTKAFLVLKDGRIVMEKYFDSFDKDSLWYWASAGKSLTAFMVGLAQEDGFLDIDDTTSQYIGSGWSVCESGKEEMITIRHQLTMTSGLDDQVSDPYCTDPECLSCLALPGSRWAYHNAPYTLLDQVLEGSMNMGLNVYIFNRLRKYSGIGGAFIKAGFNNLFISTARSMARFGLLILNRGAWQETIIMQDTAYFNEMVSPSQNLNPAYGFLWWLNGKSGFMLPGTQLTFEGALSPHAPADMISALGKNGQILNVVPSQNLVMVRMGDSPGILEIGPVLNDQIWEIFNLILCEDTPVLEEKALETPRIYPNPSNGKVRIEYPDHVFTFRIYDLTGSMIMSREECSDRYIWHNQDHRRQSVIVWLMDARGRVFFQKIFFLD